MLDFLRDLILNLPGFAGKVLLGLTGSAAGQKVEYYAAAILFLLLVVSLFLPGTMLRLRRKTMIALLFAVSPIIMLFIVPVKMTTPDSRLVLVWPYFSLIACIFIILYTLEEILIWRLLYRKRKNHYPSWLKPPDNYR